MCAVDGCWVDLPTFVKYKQAVINIQAMDNACFAWSIVTALFSAIKHPEQVLNYPSYMAVLQSEGIAFPMTLKQIKTFERLNDVSINVHWRAEKGWNISTATSH